LRGRKRKRCHDEADEADGTQVTADGKGGKTVSCGITWWRTASAWLGSHRTNRKMWNHFEDELSHLEVETRRFCLAGAHWV
jgi:hypothetical protein